MYQPSGNRQILGMGQTCIYQDHACTRPRLEGYDFCIRHILEDKNAPYKLCNYVYSSSGRRCIMPTPKMDKKESGFCAEHMRKAQLIRQKSSMRHVPPLSTESLLLSLAHYNKPDRLSADSSTVGEDSCMISLREDGEDSELPKDSEETLDMITRALNPFVEIDAAKVNGEACRVLDYASESDSDLEVATFDTTWQGGDLDSSDTESLDGSLEDNCKFSSFQHAGIYTAEEVAQLTRDKLTRLQSLYIDQFRHLQVALRERRRKYLIALKKEKETLCSIHSQRKESIREQRLYQKLKSLNRYQKRSGVEAILQKKHLERRTKATEGLTFRQPPTAKCIFTEGGVKCGEKTLPVAKHCQKHILQDNHQVLFRPCGCTKAGFKCKEPVANVFENASCVYHTSLPPPPPHLSASHIKAEADAAMELSATIKQEGKSPTVQTVNEDIVETKSFASEQELKKECREGEPPESFNSESTTDTASNEGSMEAMEDC